MYLFKIDSLLYDEVNTSTNTVLISSLYFIATVIHKTADIDVHLKISFITRFVRAEYIHISDNMTISKSPKIRFVSSYNIQQVRYKFRCKQRCYPNVKIISRSMTGYTTNHCRFGGIVLLVSLSYYDRLTRHGPYCLLYGTTLFDQLVDNVTLSNYNSQIILYSYFRMVSMDIRIYFTPSSCEGLLNACSLFSQLYQSIDTDSFTIKFIGNNMFAITIVENKCLNIQFMIEPYYSTHCIIAIGTSFMVKVDAGKHAFFERVQVCRSKC